MDDAKIEATRVEDAESSSSAPTGTHVQLPPLLRDLSVEEREKLNLHVKRKIDLRLLPMMLLMYIMNYLDRNNIAAAKLAGLSDDLNLKGNQYQTALSILFVGYLLMQAGITKNMAGVRGLGAWRWLFIIEDIGEDDWVNSEDQTFFHGAKLAAKDPKAWLLLATIYGFTSSGTVTTLFPSVVKGLGYGDVATLLLTVPPYVIGVIAILINAWHADRTRERHLHVALPPILAVAAFIIAAATVKFGPRYFAMCLMIGANYSGYVVALAWISNTLPRPPAKRAAALAGINALSNVCQIYAPYMYQDSYAPRYVVPMIVNAITSLWAIVFATILRLVLTRLNKKIEAGITLLESANEDERKHAIEEHGLPGEAVDKGFRFLV
ncbi:hypothetical protein SLS57_009918 [Botryosphaeria dothidea]